MWRSIGTRLEMQMMQDPAGRFDFYPYAPTAIAASDDGLGTSGYMDPGIASAVAIVSGRFASTRLHFEDAWLGSSNLLLAGASKVCICFAWQAKSQQQKLILTDLCTDLVHCGQPSQRCLPEQPASGCKTCAWLQDIFTAPTKQCRHCRWQNHPNCAASRGARDHTAGKPYLMKIRAFV